MDKLDRILYVCIDPLVHDRADLYVFTLSNYRLPKIGSVLE